MPRKNPLIKNKCPGLAICTIFCVLVAATGCASEGVSHDPRSAFFEHIGSLCGMQWEGVTELAPESDEIFRPFPLTLRIEECGESQVRFRFGVDDDLSRSWLLRFDGEEGLLFLQGRGDLTRGMDDGVSWGGWATDRGTEFVQSFPDYRTSPGQQAARGPRTWRLQLDDETGKIVYFLDQGDEPRFRLVFTPEPLP